MKTRWGITATALAAIVFGCQSSNSASLETDDQKASYAIGLDVGRNLSSIESHVDLPALRAGIEDALAEREQRIPEEELQEVMAAFSAAIQAEGQAEMDAMAATNLEEGTAYLAENGARDEVTTTPSGLQYEILREGDGDRPVATSQATLHYRGTLIDGTEFDSSYERGEPAVFSVGQVIPGFAEAVQLMPVGGHYRFVIPADLGYGLPGSPPSIGPNATLIFEVELIDFS